MKLEQEYEKQLDQFFRIIAVVIVSLFLMVTVYNVGLWFVLVFVL